nr:allophanate hydrolase subunit 1 [Nocardiopsis salina]
MRVLRCADRGLLLEVADLDEVVALHAALAECIPEGVTDVVPAARTVLLRLETGTDTESVVSSLGDLRRPTGTGTARGETLTVPVHYDGEDLDDIADHTGLSPREVVSAHTGTPWTVAFCGFSPGFGYLMGGDPRLDVPRRSEPRTRVPAGAVALAGTFTGVYPRVSPGGWQLLGRTEARIWDPDRDPPGLLRPGVRVRFEEAS